MTPTRHSPTSDVLRIASVRRIVLAFHAVTLAEWVLGTAVAISVYDDGGALAVGLVGFRFAPAAVAGLATSLLGDRFGRRRVLTATALVRAGAAVATAVALALGLPLAVVIAVVWLDAAAGSAYRPAQAGVLPALVTTPGELTAAAIFLSNAKTSGQLLGALAGGLMIAVLSAPTTVAVAAALYGLAALLTARAGRSHAVRGPAPGVTLRWNVRHMLGGARALAGDPATTRIALWSCARSLVRGIWVALGVVASLTTLGMGRSGFGLLMAAAGAGTVLSIPLTARLVGRRQLATPFAIGLALCCLPVAGIGLAHRSAPALALMVAWGVGMTLSDVGAQALLNRVVAPSELARVVGLMESAKLLAEGMGSILAPALVSVLGVRQALLIGGGTLSAILVADLRGFRAIDRRAVGRVEVLELAHGVPLFSALRVDGLEAVVAPLVDVHVPAGRQVIGQDGRGTRWYLVADGELEILVDGYVVNHAVRGDSFGERSLLRDEPRSATVRATTDVSLLALERADFLRAVLGQTGYDGAPLAEPPIVAADALRRQHLLRRLDASALDALAAGAEIIALDAGEAVFREHEFDDRYFVVLAGQIAIAHDGRRRRVLAAGDGFGEIAVLHRVARTMSAAALTPVELVVVQGAHLRERLDAA